MKGCVTCVYDGDCQLGTLILFVDTLICCKNEHSCSKGWSSILTPILNIGNEYFNSRVMAECYHSVKKIRN